MSNSAPGPFLSVTTSVGWASRRLPVSLEPTVSDVRYPGGPGHQPGDRGAVLTVDDTGFLTEPELLPDGGLEPPLRQDDEWTCSSGLFRISMQRFSAIAVMAEAASNGPVEANPTGQRAGRGSTAFRWVTSG